MEMPEPQFLPMPDPCPHVSRMDIMRAKISGIGNLDDLLSHVDSCHYSSWHPKMLDAPNFVRSVN